MPKKQGRYAILTGDFWRNKKIEALSPEAAGVYAKCLSYSADQMTDGVIPASLVRSWCGGKKANRIIKELTTAPENWPHGHYFPILVRILDEYQIYNYLKRNVSRKDWKRIQEKDRKRKHNVKLDFLPGFGDLSGGNPDRIPAGSSRPKTQDSLKRESAPPLVPEIPEEEQIGKDGQNGNISPHVLVCELWTDIGRELTGDRRLYTDPEIEDRIAWKVWERAKAVDPEAPLRELAKVFRSWWTAWARRPAPRPWPRLRFLLEDFDGHVDGPAQRARLQLEAAEREANDREYELRQALIAAQGRHDLMGTDESRAVYEQARAAYNEFKNRKAN